MNKRVLRQVYIGIDWFLDFAVVPSAAILAFWNFKIKEYFWGILFLIIFLEVLTRLIKRIKKENKK